MTDRAIRVVHAKGDGVARGLADRDRARRPDPGSVSFYHRYLDRRGVSSERLQDLLTPYLVAAETTYPDMMNVLKGMSAGAMVPILELFAINAFEELEPLLESPEGELLFLQKKEGYTEKPGGPERCSSVAVRTPNGGTLLAHNEHWLAGDVGNVAVIVDAPGDGRVPVASPTVVCCLPAVGLNAHGTAQGIGSLTAEDDGLGIPRVLVSRSSLEARDRVDAVARASMPGRAGGYGHVFAFAGGEREVVETSGRQHRVLEEPRPHTNHYQSDLAALAPPPSEGSARATPTTGGAAGGTAAHRCRRPDGGDARPHLRPPGDLPASRHGRGRRGFGLHVLDGVRRGEREDVGGAGQPVRERLPGDRPGRVPNMTRGGSRAADPSLNRPAPGSEPPSTGSTQGRLAPFGAPMLYKRSLGHGGPLDDRRGRPHPHREQPEASPHA